MTQEPPIIKKNRSLRSGKGLVWKCAKNALRSLSVMITTFAKNVSSQKKSKMTLDEKMKMKMWIDEELMEHRETNEN